MNNKLHKNQDEKLRVYACGRDILRGAPEGSRDIFIVLCVSPSSQRARAVGETMC